MKVQRVCRVCGKTYVVCDAIRSGDKNFNWRKVACSPECGARYLREILESRGQLPKQQAGAAEEPRQNKNI